MKQRVCQECGSSENLVEIRACGAFKGSGRKIILCSRCLQEAANPAQPVVKTAGKVAEKRTRP